MEVDDDDVDDDIDEDVEGSFFPGSSRVICSHFSSSPAIDYTINQSIIDHHCLR